MNEQEKTVSQVIEEVKEQMCEEYCIHPKELLNEEDLLDMCTVCPLNKL